jgi:PIN domain nuclease of toxin-antitoxin system
VAPGVLLDTHVLIRFLVDPKRLSRYHNRVLATNRRRSETSGISAITLWEVATIYSRGALRAHVNLDELLAQLEDNPVLQILPLSVTVAKESAHLRHALRDPADCIIVATARVHGLRLLTSDQRIIESNLVSTVE